MNKVIGILSFVVVVGFTLPEVSWADKHVATHSEEKRPSPILAERDGFVGPVMSGESLPHPAEHSSWNRLSLTHTDTPHLFSRDTHPSGAYRNSQPVDGTALMFSWPFESLTTFPMSIDGAPRERNLTRDDEMTHPYLR